MSPRARVLRSLAFLFLACLTSTVCLACRRSGPTQPPPPREVVVFAAASLQDVLKDLAVAYESAGSAKLVFNFAGSQDLARQIQSSHAADVFVSASEDWMDRIDKAGLLVPATRTTFLSNRLVVIANHDTPITLKTPEDLANANFEVLALGDPKGVPAGQYAKEWLERVKQGDTTVWDHVKDRVSPAPNVRAALAMVEAHPSAVGIVYRTDIVRSQKVRVLYEVPEASGPKIRYVAAALAGRPQTDDAKRFVSFLSGNEARDRFTREGFVVPSHP